MTWPRNNSRIVKLCFVLLVPSLTLNLSLLLSKCKKKCADARTSFMCRPSEVDVTWKHTGNASCSDSCLIKVGKNGRTYFYDNVKRSNKGILSTISTHNHRKATRWGTDQAVIDFIELERKNGRGWGNILGISGSNYFDLFHNSKSTFTTADYPQVSCEDMPYLDNTFDYLVCNQVLEHVSKPWLCMDEFHRVLKKGGHAIVVVPSIYQEHRWPKDNWRLLKDGMEVLLGEFSHRTVGSFGNSALLKHMIDHPNDRYSQKMMKLAISSHHTNESLYYTSVYGIGKK